VKARPEACVPSAVPRTPTVENPLFHAGHALFAAINGDEAALERALNGLLVVDHDGRHRRWAIEEVLFAPFRGAAWFTALCGPPVGMARARPARA
jgi:hypothetical protein